MNNKTILALSNPSNTGKTDSLRAAANYLLDTFPNFSPVEGAPFIVPDTGDFRIVIKINKKIIAVESQGDPNTGLLERLTELGTNFKADVILCSSRTRGATVGAIWQFRTQHGYEMIWDSTYQVDVAKQQRTNTLKGEHIINLLQGLSLI